MSYLSYRTKRSNVDGMKERRNDGMTDRLKTLYPLNYVLREYKNRQEITTTELPPWNGQ